jgi:hypothetical protein
MSLLPELYPAPAVRILPHLPGPEASEAILLLTGLLVKTSPALREATTDE